MPLHTCRHSPSPDFHPGSLLPIGTRQMAPRMPPIVTHGLTGSAAYPPGRFPSAGGLTSPRHSVSCFSAEAPATNSRLGGALLPPSGASSNGGTVSSSHCLTPTL